MNVGNHGRECKSSIDAEIQCTSYKWYLKNWSLLYKHYDKGVKSLEFDVADSKSGKCQLSFTPGKLVSDETSSSVALVKSSQSPYPSSPRGLYPHSTSSYSQPPCGYESAPKATTPPAKQGAVVDVDFLGNIDYHTMEITISVVDKSMKKLQKIRNVYERTSPNPTRRTLYFETVFVAPKINEYLQNDTLILLFELKVAKSIVQIPINVESFVPNITDCTRNEINDLYKTKKLCDVTFAFKKTSQTLSAHKIILAGNSQVFRAMFTNDMQEQNEGVVEIQDIDLSLFETFLNYLYTGIIDEIGEVVHELIIVADKYQVDSLKHICEQYMQAHLSDANVIWYLLTAHQLSCETLMAEAIKYLKDNLHILSDADEYKMLSKYPKLIQLIFGNLASDNTLGERQSNEADNA